MDREHSPSFLRLVEDARQRVREIDAAKLRERMRENSALRLIDVREESEYEAAHVRGSVHIGRGVIERDIEKAVPDRETEVILYCGGGFRSALAAENLQKMGYSNIYSLAGGFRALKAEGYPLAGRDAGRSEADEE